MPVLAGTVVRSSDLAEGNYALVSRCGAWLDNVEAAQMMKKSVDEMSTAAETGSVCPA